MHELAITKTLMGTIRETIEQHNLTNVSVIHLELGLLSTYKKEPLLHYFNELKLSNPMLSNAQLVIEEKEGACFCNDCNKKFFVKDDFLTQCPHCGSFSLHIQEGKDIIIKNIRGS